MDETVDVGVVTWNTKELSVAALRRLLDTDQGCRIRLLVRDNGSTDGTAAAIAAAVPEADLDAGGDNLGFAAGVNGLLARSSAPWFLTLNSDAWPEPGAVGRMVAAAKDRPGAAAVAPRLERPDGSLEHSTHPFPSLGVAAIVNFGGHRWLPRSLADRLLLEGSWDHDRRRPVDWAVGAALLMRRDAIDAVGGFDERFFMYAEDLEWCWRARRGGWEIWFEPDAVVRHVGNASGSQSYGQERTAAYFRNTYRFYRATHGPASTAAYRALNLIGSSREYLRARARRDRATAAAWRSQLAVHVRAIPDTDRPPPR